MEIGGRMPEYNPNARLDTSQIRDERRQSRKGNKGLRRNWNRHRKFAIQRRLMRQERWRDQNR